MSEDNIFRHQESLVLTNGLFFSECVTSKLSMEYNPQINAGCLA